MNAKVKELFRKLLSFRNIVPLLIIIGAFIGTFGTAPFGLQRDQLILGLLAFLAIDTLIERLELLTNIEKDVETLKTNIEKDVGTLKNLIDIIIKNFDKVVEMIKEIIKKITEPFLKESSHKDLKIETYSNGAKELFYEGVSCYTLVNSQTAFFKEWLEKGNSLRFLISNPKSNWLKDKSLLVRDYDEDSLVKEIELALRKIREFKKSQKGKVEIKLTNSSPTQGICIVDGGEYLNSLSKIVVSLYLPNDDWNSRPSFILSQSHDEKWFNLFHERYYNDLWKSSEQYEHLS